jgi:hypothetical protein
MNDINQFTSSVEQFSKTCDPTEIASLNGGKTRFFIVSSRVRGMIEKSPWLPGACCSDAPTETHYIGIDLLKPWDLENDYSEFRIFALCVIFLFLRRILTFNNELIQMPILSEDKGDAQPTDSKGSQSLSTPYIWWYQVHVVPYMGWFCPLCPLFPCLCTRAAPEVQRS